MLAIGIPLLAAMTEGIAQTDAGSLLNQLEHQQPHLPQRLPDAAPAKPAPPLRDIGGVRFALQAVRFTGVLSLVPEAELHAIVAPSIGKTVDLADLQALTRKLTDHLRSRGFFLAQAYLPEQDVTDGFVTIEIVAGRIDGGSATPYRIVPVGAGTLRIAPDRLQALLHNALPPGEVPRTDDLERALLLINDLPGLQARARLEGGAEAGTTRVTVEVEEGPLWSGTVWADNHGNRDTGSAQLNASLRLNDVAGHGDLASAQVTDSAGLRLLRLGYSHPLGDDGLRLGGSLGLMDYRIRRGIGADTGLSGGSRSVDIDLSYPFVRQRALNLQGKLVYTHKALKDDFFAGTLRDKRIDALSLQASGDRLDGLGGGGLNWWSLGWTLGRLDLSRQDADRIADAAGYGTQGAFEKLSYGLARLQQLPGAFSLLASLSGQLARKNLDTSEKFLLGGPQGVRAYPGAEASGDEGWLGSVELRYELPGGTPLGALQLSGFVDTGRIVLHHDPRGLPIASLTGSNRYALSGWGLGASLSKAGSHSVRLVWARKSGENPGRDINGRDVDGHADQSRVWLQATLRF